MAPEIGVPQTPFALVQSRRHEAPAQPKGSRCGGCPGRCTGRRGSPHPQTLETHRPDPPPRPWPVGSPRPRPRPAGTTSGHSPGRGHPPPTCGQCCWAPQPGRSSLLARKELTAPAKGNQGEKDQGLRTPHGGRGPERQPRQARLSEHAGAGEPRAGRERCAGLGV